MGNGVVEFIGRLVVATIDDAKRLKTAGQISAYARLVQSSTKADR